MTRMIEVNYIADVLYGGVDFSLPGNGGKECAAFLSSKQRVVETAVYELFTCFVLWKMLGKVSIPEKLPAYREGTGVGKRMLLVVHCLIFGIEIGFKFATKQVIFLLNPCHVLTAIQVSLDCICFLSLSLCYHPSKSETSQSAATFRAPQVKGHAKCLKNRLDYTLEICLTIIITSDKSRSIHLNH